MELKRYWGCDNFNDLLEVGEKETNRDKFWYFDLLDTLDRASNKLEKKLTESTESPNKRVKIASIPYCFGFGNSSENVR